MLSLEDLDLLDAVAAPRRKASRGARGAASSARQRRSAPFRHRADIAVQFVCPIGCLGGLGLGEAMLSVGKLAVGQADYYLEQAHGAVTRAGSVRSGVEDYYLGGPEAAGAWIGV